MVLNQHHIIMFSESQRHEELNADKNKGGGGVGFLPSGPCKEVADARVGIGMGRMGRIPSIQLENSRISISCLSKDIDPIFKIFKSL